MDEKLILEFRDSVLNAIMHLEDSQEILEELLGFDISEEHKELIEKLHLIIRLVESCKDYFNAE